MSNTATDIVQPSQPDPDRAEPARLDPAGVGKILRLLRTLAAYGRNLVQKLREEDDPDDLPWYAFLTTILGTTDPAVITVVIIRGLLRARALQARLSQSIATFLPLPLREDRPAKRIDGGRAPNPRTPRSAAGWTIPPGWPAEDPSLDRQPEPEEQMYAEIVAKDRDRPIGAILLDICLDLAIVPGLMHPAAWNELRLAITLYGGDPAPLLADAERLAETGVTGAGRKSEVHSATGTPDPNDSPLIAPQPAITYPPWPAPPEHPPPLEGESSPWGRGPDP
jgi:hypothetical protein